MNGREVESPKTVDVPTSDQQQVPQSISTPASPESDKWDKAVSSIGAIMFPLLLLASWVAAFITPLVEGNQLSIVASLNLQDAKSWELRGRVLRDGDGQLNTKVWAILTNSRGDRDSPPAMNTDDKGGFVFS